MGQRALDYVKHRTKLYVGLLCGTWDDTASPVLDKIKQIPGVGVLFLARYSHPMGEDGLVHRVTAGRHGQVEVRGIRLSIYVPVQSILYVDVQGRIELTPVNATFRLENLGLMPFSRARWQTATEELHSKRPLSTEQRSA